MQALDFWKTVTADRSNLLESLIALLDQHQVRYCVIGGQAVNAYAEPVVSLDLDLAVAVAEQGRVEHLLTERFGTERFAHSLNVHIPGSDVRVQIRTDPRYGEFVERASVRDVLGLELPVAQVEDVLQGKIWAVQDETRRGSKRQKDLADIARLIEARPALRERLPAEILARLL